jgi:hypothetical protein
MIQAMMLFVFVDHVAPLVTRRQHRNFYTTELTGKDNARVPGSG